MITGNLSRLRNNLERDDMARHNNAHAPDRQEVIS